MLVCGATRRAGGRRTCAFSALKCVVELSLHAICATQRDAEFDSFTRREVAVDKSGIASVLRTGSRQDQAVLNLVRNVLVEGSDIKRGVAADLLGETKFILGRSLGFQTVSDRGLIVVSTMNDIVHQTHASIGVDKFGFLNELAILRMEYSSVSNGERDANARAYLLSDWSLLQRGIRNHTVRVVESDRRGVNECPAVGVYVVVSQSDVQNDIRQLYVVLHIRGGVNRMRRTEIQYRTVSCCEIAVDRISQYIIAVVVKAGSSEGGLLLRQR